MRFAVVWDADVIMQTLGLHLNDLLKLSADDAWLRDQLNKLRE